jgi:endonuclease YncB( thermonuclease family)
MKDPKITKPVGVNKDGYASGGVEIEVPSQNLELDPRSKSSIRGRNYVAQGDTVTVKGTKTRKPVKATWY